MGKKNLRTFKSNKVKCVFFFFAGLLRAFNGPSMGIKICSISHMHCIFLFSFGIEPLALGFPTTYFGKCGLRIMVRVLRSVVFFDGLCLGPLLYVI